MQPKRIIILIDGGYLRARATDSHHKDHRFKYDPGFIERVALECRANDEEVIRVLYYDCASYAGTVKLPVSGKVHTYTGSDDWLHTLAQKDLFAVRRGVLKFRGFMPKRIPVAPDTLRDDDFTPVFVQKGVDMRLGLDMSAYSQQRSIERIVLISGDTDCIAAMKYCRKAGLQVVLIQLPEVKLSPELIIHADFTRAVAWPKKLAMTQTAS